MEETYRHGAGNESGDLRANVSSQAYHRFIGETSGTIETVPTMIPWPAARDPSRVSGWGDQVDFRLHLSRRFGQAGAGIVGVAVAIRVLTLPVTLGRPAAGRTPGGPRRCASALVVAAPAVRTGTARPLSVAGAVGATPSSPRSDCGSVATQVPDFTLVAAVAFAAILIGAGHRRAADRLSAYHGVVEPDAVGAGARRCARRGGDLRRAVADRSPSVRRASGRLPWPSPPWSASSCSSPAALSAALAGWTRTPVVGTSTRHSVASSVLLAT